MPKIVRPTGNRTAPVSVRFRPELKEMIEQAAADDHRTVTSWIEKTCVAELKRIGLIKK